MPRFLIAVDDTDTPQAGGTGRLCRQLAEELRSSADIWGVTRHQLAVLPEIPYTRKNSANVVHLTCAATDFESIVEYAVVWVADHCCPGSRPGLCAGSCRTLRDISLGRAAQQRVVTVQETWQAAERFEVILRVVAGDGHGIVGALAAAALASSGSDGRFVEAGAVRELDGIVPIAEAIDAGVDGIRTVTGEPVADGHILVSNGLRPALCEGRVVLFVEHSQEGWLPVKGWPQKPVPEPVRVERQQIR
jgi:hypothetical protein